MMNDPDVLVIDGVSIKRGEQKTIDLNIAKLYDFTDIVMSIHVIRGKNPGPTVFISGAIHGDEIIGPEIIKRFLKHKKLKLNCGTLIAIPIVNVFGYNSRSRYFPDRRDLNRSFPGSSKGSLSSRVADKFLTEIVNKSDYGIDIHSGAVHRANLPQIRACLSEKETKRIALMFGTPVILDSDLRDGSLRSSAKENGVNILVFEGGEALRFDESVIKVCIAGIFSVLSGIGMISPREQVKKSCKSYIAKLSYWIRAPQSGAMRQTKRLGSEVQKNSVIGEVSDVFGNKKYQLVSRCSGIIIGENRLPLVNKGDATFHIASFEDDEAVRDLSEEYSDILEV